MATKKKKPTAAEFNTVDVESETQGKAPVAEILSESDKIQSKAGTLDLSISDEIKQKLDSIDKLMDENAKYAERVSQLQDCIAGYISEIAQLNKKIAELSDAEEKTKKLESEIVKLKSMIPTRQQPVHQTHLTPNCYRRRIIGEYPSWN